MKDLYSICQPIMATIFLWWNIRIRNKHLPQTYRWKGQKYNFCLNFWEEELVLFRVELMFFYFYFFIITKCRLLLPWMFFKFLSICVQLNVAADVRNNESDLCSKTSKKKKKNKRRFPTWNEKPDVNFLVRDEISQSQSILRKQRHQKIICIQDAYTLRLGK